jgi:hypothetical protein
MKKSEIAACDGPAELRALYIRENPKAPIAKMEFWVNKIINHRKNKGYKKS